MEARRLRIWVTDARRTLKLALPIMSGMVGQMLMGLADTLMVGRVGVIPLAAAAFVNTIVHLPLVFAIGLLSSISVLAAQAFGGRQKAEAGEIFRHGLVLCVGVSVLAAAALVALRPFLGLFGQPPEVVAASRMYLILLGSSIVPAMVAQVGKQFGEAIDQPWLPTLLLLGGVLLNILLNWIFIFGHWGAPALGLNGAGVATLMARTATAVCLIGLVVRSTRFRPFHPRRWCGAFGGWRFRRLLGLGWPVGVQHLLEVSAFAFAALMMGWISAEALAAHQIAITCAATTFMFALGIGIAVSIRVGQAWGAGRGRRMRRIGWVGLALGGGLMSGFGVLFILFRWAIAGLFVSEAKVVELAATMLFLAALFQIVDGLQVVGISALRGLMDVRVPALIAVLAYWGVAVPCGYLLGFPLGWGAAGIWTGLAVGLGTAAFGLVWRFHLKTKVRG